MKLWKKIMLGLLAVILGVAVFVTVWQWENIGALYLLATNSGEDIQQMAEDKHNHKNEVLGKYEGIVVQDISPEEEKALIHGEISVDQVVTTIDNSDKPETKSEQKAPSTQKPAQKTQKEKETEIVNRYLKEIYKLKAEFLGKLAKLKDEAQAEFYKFPMEERTQANKTAVITDKIIDCYELENSCDIAIEKLLKGLTSELKAIGGDTSIVDEIRKAYKEEKKVKKAYYIKLATE